jgi:hypothetical protein
LDPDEEDLSSSDSDDSGDDIRPQTSAEGGQIVVSDRGTCDAVVNSDEAASSDRKSEDAVDDLCTSTIAVETACK